MTSYFIRTILCSGLLMLFYTLFLEREKLLRFNRFYLLLSIAFSFIVPLITFSSPGSAEIVEKSIALNTTVLLYQVTDAVNTTIPVKKTDWFINSVIVFYIIVTVIQALRFARNIYPLIYTRKNFATSELMGVKLVLIENAVTPFGFLNKVYLNKKEFESGKIEQEILLHELAHIKQKHSLDILFVEILLVFAWFNPFLFLYRRAIRLNHEFLADDAVLAKEKDVSAYQYLLLEKTTQQDHHHFTSSFNFLNIKKRFLMMTQHTTAQKAIIRQLTLIPVLLLLLIFFSDKILSQKNDVPKVLHGEAPSTKEGVSKELMDEYEAISGKYLIKDANGHSTSNIFKRITKPEMDRLETIFRKMSKEQQSKVNIVFMPPIRPLPKTVPTGKMMQDFSDPAYCGLWINEKRVSNETIKKYRTSDFSQVFISNLSPNALAYGKYKYQVNLMTNDFYNDYYAKTMADTSHHMAVVFRKKEKKN
ncbi:MAG: Regulatory sensor-transducer, BlaR1/MecR1 family [Chitinophagaceae bacterium]|nr:Regulatory sensor-transducer, BlaR1/MecR1 family [Chitinophagaceae bacterium]